ncbi:YraN family protein [Calidifontibacter indicus]|uniref:YraN family protein n=1 Tax=Calidifontibacter indicus TaxID=419650 RepID=UPI003D71DB79
MDEEMTRHRRSLGAQGEEIAADYLRSLDWSLLERNWRCNEGELDLIAYDCEIGAVVAVEVKTRNTAHFGRPVEHVGQDKIDRVHRLVRRWLYEQGLFAREVRVDLIGIVLVDDAVVDLEHLRDIA